MARSTLRITDAWLSKEQRPGLYWCKRHTCLGVRVGKSGTKAFIYQKGKSKRITLGRVGYLTLSQAQERSLELDNSGVAVGTIGDAFELWARRHLIDAKSQVTVDNRRLQLSKWLDWRFPLSRINHAWAQNLQLRIAENSIWAANDVMRHTRTLYKTATGSDWPFELRPLSTRKLKAKSKRRVMEDPALWWSQISSLQNPILRSYWLMIAMTGLRESEVKEAKWIHISDGFLHVYNAKGGDAFDRPLPRQVFEQLPPRLSDWVFPGSGEKGCLVNPKPATIRHLCSEHAIRHWWRTIAEVEAEAPFPVVAALLNHKEKRGMSDSYGVRPARLTEWSQKIADTIADQLKI